MDSISQTAYERRLIKSLLVQCGVKRNNFTFPTSTEFVFSEIVNGFADFSSVSDCCRYIGFGRDTFYDSAQKIVSSIQEKNESSHLFETFGYLFSPYYERSPPEQPFQTSNFELHWKGDYGVGIASGIMSSTFSLPYDLVEGSRHQFSTFSDFEQDIIRAVGEKMVSFVEDDLAYLKANAPWY